MTVGCTDFTADNLELCDGANNDCRSTTPDGADEPVIKTPTACDGIGTGGDSDVCLEGQYICSGGTIQCTDPNNDNTSNDVDNCGACNDPCTRVHVSSTGCSGSVCQPVCAFGWQSCDNNVQDNDCETTRVTNPLCSALPPADGGPEDMGEIDGDDSGAGKTRTGFYERWFKVLMLEKRPGRRQRGRPHHLHQPARRPLHRLRVLRLLRQQPAEVHDPRPSARGRPCGSAAPTTPSATRTCCSTSPSTTPAATRFRPRAATGR
jgi:hypothetical protein